MDPREKQAKLLAEVNAEAKRLAIEEVRSMKGLSVEARLLVARQKAKQWKRVLLQEQDPRHGEWRTNREMASLRRDFSQTGTDGY